MLHTQDAFNNWKQRGVLRSGPGRIPRLPSQIGEVGTSGQGDRVFSPGHPLDHWEQRGVLRTGPDRIPASPVESGDWQNLIADILLRLFVWQASRTGQILALVIAHRQW